MERRTLATRTEHVANMATAKGQLGIVSLVSKNLAQVYFKTIQRRILFFFFFIFGGREFRTDDPENAKLVLYRSIRVRCQT